MNKLKEKVETLLRNNDRITINGLGFAERAYLLSGLNQKSLLVCVDETEIERTKAQLEGLNKKVFVLTEKLPLLFGMNETANPLFKDYYKVLGAISQEEFDVVLVLPQVLMQKLPNKKQLQKAMLNLQIGKNYDISSVVSTLSILGYRREEMVSNSGTFALRGDILDIYLQNPQKPVRISFFDDEIESINTFNENTFLTEETLEKVEILPSTLALVAEEEKREVATKIIQAMKAQKLSDEAMLRLSEVCEFQLEKLKDGLTTSSAFFLPFCDVFDSTILDYFDENCVLCFNEPKRVLDLIDFYYKEFNESFDSLYNKGEYLLEHKNFYIEKTHIFDKLSNKKMIGFDRLFNANSIFETENSLSVRCFAPQKYYLDLDEFVKDVRNFSNDNKTVFLSCGLPLTVNRISGVLKEFNIAFKQVSSLEEVDEKGVYISECNIPSSVLLFDLDFMLIGSNELNHNPVETKKQEVKVKPVFLPKVGDFVVHQVHGVGKCVAIEKLKLSSTYRDYLVLEYQGGDILYLPTENVDVLSAFMGEENPKCNKIGGTEFYKTKQKVKDSIKKMAIDLLKIYAQRQNSKGFKYSPDTYLQAEFENAFEYSHTSDQAQAIKDIKDDMESNRIMERLVCGDVGFGKTEVALVAAFKAIQDGKQVAIVCPTTILSQQHYNTALARMKEFAVNVAVINRFKTKKEQERILEDLAKGKIDIICGTHRLLSKDVIFKDLGLLILDEEQRFGVEDKDKLKTIKTNVDVLTLSATPIPRTLHMSLVGIRDLSFLNTPPKDRLPIQTVVIDYSDNLLVDAAQKEIARGGQVLIIYNRVETIMDFYGKVRALLPDVTIGVAHGQMDSKTLEDAIYKLYTGQTQVLISTVLIENGVDLPMANTLIVIDADKLGLSQLYQIRGRIGRGTRSAFAYLTFARNKVLSQEAYKRLDALMEFSEFGSGYKIAMRDLEIRGAGDVLGSQQHGHIQKVGYDLYVKLLNEAVSEIKGEKVEEAKEVKIFISLNAHLPKEYVAGDENRISCYSKISKISCMEDITKLEEEFENIYGKMPKETLQLCFVAMIKNMSQKLGVKMVKVDDFGAKITFYEDVVGTLLYDFLSKGSVNFVLNATTLPIITIPNGASIQENQKNTIKFLQDCLEHKA